MKTFRTRACVEDDEAEARLIQGVCPAALSDIADNSIDLVVTSPPYADQREDTYGGIHPDEYVEWFLPLGKELFRVLKPTGTFILNIKEKVVEGERHTYVLDLIKALRVQGWLWTEEYIWKKRNAAPGKWPNRFRDAWERLLQFNKQRKFAMYQEAVMVPMGDWANSRLKKLGANDVHRRSSKTGSGVGIKMRNWVNREMAYPTNVVELATESANTGHSAAYPKELPAWFIKLFTQRGDMVLDPFVGSGTTCVAAMELGRNSIGIEKLSDHVALAEDNLSKATSL